MRVFTTTIMSSRLPLGVLYAYCRYWLCKCGLTWGFWKTLRRPAARKTSPNNSWVVRLWTCWRSRWWCSGLVFGGLPESTGCFSWCLPLEPIPRTEHLSLPIHYKVIESSFESPVFHVFLVLIPRSERAHPTRVYIGNNRALRRGITYPEDLFFSVSLF